MNESPAEAVAREVREEAGVQVRPYKLVAVWDRARHPHGTVQPFHVWRLFFLCEITGGAALIWINRSVKRGHARQMDVDVLGSVDWAQDMEVGDMGAATR